MVGATRAPLFLCTSRSRVQPPSTPAVYNAGLKRRGTSGRASMARQGIRWFVLVALASALLVPGDTLAQAKPKVAFVYTGPIGDAGWTFQHDVARKHLEQALGADTTYVENMPETAEAARVMEQLIQKGYKILFMTS